MGKTVYAAFTSEVIHEGHKNILEEAKKYGDVIVVSTVMKRSCGLTAILRCHLKSG